MNANEVIESYVTDVAEKLPRKQRNDVAFELRSLLNEELQGKAVAAGRPVDAAMATELVNAFGRPSDVAARYRPTLTVIDPADGHGFVRASVIGLAVIWIVGLLLRLEQASESGWGLLTTLERWWLGTVIPSLWWPGVLVVAFGLAAWARRRWPASKWKARPGDRIQGGRATMVVGLVAILCGTYLLINPRWILDYFWDGHAAPAAYEALTYTNTFLRLQAPWLLALILLNIPLFITVIVTGRWSVSMRRMEMGLALLGCAFFAWTILGGPITLSPVSDQMIKLSLVLIIVLTLIGRGIELFRSVRPAPN